MCEGVRKKEMTRGQKATLFIECIFPPKVNSASQKIYLGKALTLHTDNRLAISEEPPGPPSANPDVQLVAEGCILTGGGGGGEGWGSEKGNLLNSCRSLPRQKSDKMFKEQLLLKLTTKAL